MAFYGRVGEVRVHRQRVVTPNAESLDVVHMAVHLLSNLSQRTVVVQSSHRSKVLPRNVLSVVRRYQTVRVSRVSDNDYLNVSTSIVVNSFASFNENFTIILD